MIVRRSHFNKKGCGYWLEGYPTLIPRPIHWFCSTKLHVYPEKYIIVHVEHYNHSKSSCMWVWLTSGWQKAVVQFNCRQVYGEVDL